MNIKFLRTPNIDVSMIAAPLTFGFNFVKKSAAYTWTFTVHELAFLVLYYTLKGHCTRCLIFASYHNI